jgi:ABC-type sugar transport system substrate-binding protein
MIMRRFTRAVLGAAVALALVAAPAAAAQPERVPVMDDCLLPPGVYGITDSQGNLVGILIVYPDCRMEVFKKQEPV